MPPDSQTPRTGSSCQKCGGDGKIVYRTIGDAMPTDLGNGVAVQNTGGFSTRACSCVRDLPPIEGKATWWESETAWSVVFTDTIISDAAEITVDAEVPRDENGRRVVMRGNRYYPTWVELQAPPRMLMHPDAARAFALKLLAAAEACDAVDDPCSDECGHWAPCGCADGPLPEIGF